MHFRKLVAIFENFTTFGDYNLQQKFHHYNQLLFENRVPPCPIIWAELNGQAGITYFRYQGRNLVPGSLRIEMSTRFKRTEQMLDCTLIHEMIHAYLAATGDPDAKHGHKFQVWALTCTHKVGFPITLTDDISDLELTSEEHVLTSIVLRKWANIWHANFYSGTFFDNPQKMNELLALYGAPGKIKEGEEMLVVKMQTSLMKKYGGSRAVRQAAWIKINPQELNSILQHGQIIRRVEPNSVSHEYAAEHLPTKQTLVVLRTSSRGEVQATFLMPSIAKDPNKLNDLYRKYWPYERAGFTVEFFTTTTTIFNRGFTMSRDVNNGAYFNVKPDTVAELRRKAIPIKFGFHGTEVHLGRS